MQTRIVKPAVGQKLNLKQKSNKIKVFNNTNLSIEYLRKNSLRGHRRGEQKNTLFTSNRVICLC